MAGTSAVEGDEYVRAQPGRSAADAAMMALVLAGASAIKDDSVRAQPRRLLLCFGQRDCRAAHRPTNTDNREHTARFFRISTTYIEEH